MPVQEEAALSGLSLRLQASAHDLLAHANRQIDPGIALSIHLGRAAALILRREAIVLAGLRDAVAFLVLVSRLLRMHLCPGAGRDQQHDRRYANALRLFIHLLLPS